MRLSPCQRRLVHLMMVFVCSTTGAIRACDRFGSRGPCWITGRVLPAASAEQEHGRRGNRGDVRSRPSGRTPAYNASPYCLVSRTLNSSGVEGIPCCVMGHYVSLGPIERLMTYASAPVPRGLPCIPSRENESLLCPALRPLNALLT